MRIGRLAWLFFTFGSLNELQYRANFFIQLLQSAVSVGVALVVLALVYSQTTELNGWSESELMIVLGIQILLGAVTIYCFWLVIATLAFWIVNVWEIIELFDGIYQAGRWPTSIFPGWLRFGVTFIFPLAFAITVPAEAVTSRLEWSTVGIAIGFAVVLFAFTRWWWGFGLRRYSGASA